MKFAKKLFFILGLALLSYPSYVLSQGGSCSIDGFTIMTVNGVFTDEEEAKINKDNLKRLLPESYGSESINIDYLHNPSHIGGLGDILKAAYQKVFDTETVSDYDLKEMIKSASEKVTTQKLLLVAHSQGNFYANSFYDTVAGADGGVPLQSIGVYSVATPASRVAGGGKWLTSDTDAVIAGLVGRLPTRGIMKPNTHIVLATDETTHGHGFSEVYLKYRGAEIVKDIHASLDALRTNNIQKTDEACIDSPKLSLFHKVKGLTFAVVDPTANVTRDTVVFAGSALYATGNFALHASAKIGDGIIGIGSFVVNKAEDLASIAGSAVPMNPIIIPGVSKNMASVALSGGSATDAGPTTTSAPANPSANVEQSSIRTATVVASESAQATTDELVIESTVSPTREQRTVQPTPPPPTQSPAPFSITPGFGGGAPPPVPEVRATETTSQAIVPAPPPPDTVAPATPVITSPQQTGSRFTMGSVEFQGTAEAGSSVHTGVASTTVSESGAWTLTLSLTDGAHALEFYSKDSAGNQSESAPITVEVDTTAPEFSVSVDGCTRSISAETCIMFGGAVTAQATTTAPDFSYFLFDLRGQSATSTERVSYNLSEAGAHTLTVAAYDTIGNHSATTSISFVVEPRPVIINEVAWMGTQAETEDEWIELYNTTDYPIDLSSFVLYSEDFSPYLPLTGTVAPHGYYLIERKNGGESDELTESPVTDIVAGTWASFGSGLGNGGEMLTLVSVSGNATSTSDSVPKCGAVWCAGANLSSSRRFSMERFDPNGSSADPENWGTAVGEFVINGTDAKQFPVKGTPGRRNSINYYIINTPNIQTITENVTLTKDRSPYFIPRWGLTVNAGVTLTIEPGVVIKSDPLRNAVITVEGAIVAEGTAEEPIVFTSVYDDGYGGSINTGPCIRAACPGVGDWNQIVVKNSPLPSRFSNVIFRYGGFAKTGSSLFGAVSVEKSTVYFDRVTMEKNNGRGIQAKNATIEVSNSTFVENVGSGIDTGISTTTVRDSRFEKNGEYGIKIDTSPGYILERNTFLENKNGEQLIIQSIDLLTVPVVPEVSTSECTEGCGGGDGDTENASTTPSGEEGG